MKAKIRPRVTMDNRTRLEDVIPLSTPLLVFIDPSNACNFRCKFCFHSNSQRLEQAGIKQAVMKYELFTKIIDDLKLFPNKLKCLRLYKDGEPLINKRLPEMISYARKMDVSETIDFTTNGSLLSPEKNLSLIHAGLDRIVISVEGLSSEKYREISKVDINFESLVDNIKHFYNNRGNCTVCIKSTDVGVDGEKEKFFEIFGDICDEIYLESITPVWPCFDISHIKTNFDTDILGHEIEKVQVCPISFYSIAVNTDGSVSPCVVDWEHGVTFGNVNHESIVNIWNGSKLNDFRRMQLQKCRFTHPVCGNCGQLVYGFNDNIDAHAEELLKYFNQKYLERILLYG